MGVCSRDMDQERGDRERDGLKIERGCMETCSYQERDLPYATLPDVRPSTTIVATAPKRHEEVETASFVYEKGIAASTFSGARVRASGQKLAAGRGLARGNSNLPGVSMREQPLAYLFHNQWAVEKIKGYPVADDNVVACES